MCMFPKHIFVDSFSINDLVKQGKVVLDPNLYDNIKSDNHMERFLVIVCFNSAQTVSH